MDHRVNSSRLAKAGLIIGVVGLLGITLVILSYSDSSHKGFLPRVLNISDDCPEHHGGEIPP